MEVDSSEKLLENSDDQLTFAGTEFNSTHDGELSVLLNSYRRRIALLTASIVALLCTTIALTICLVLKKPTDHECGVQTSIYCMYQCLMN